LEPLVASAHDFLLRHMSETGQFTYGFQPATGRLLSGYNIIRHICAVWSLIEQYQATANPALIEPIQRSLNYALQFVIDRDQSTSYVAELTDQELELGATATMIITLVKYMQTFADKRYEPLVQRLSQGLQSFYHSDTGTYDHVFYYRDPQAPDFTLKEAQRIVYYDGEATLAFLNLYAYTHDEQYLQAATAAVDYFIQANYEQYADHWVAYSLRELLRYRPLPQYYEFALRNVSVNLDDIYQQRTSYHTYMEVLMATFEVLDQLSQSPLATDLLSQFDTKKFIDAIFYRADFMLNGYFYPEVAMYVEQPDSILGAFFVRHDAFRTRIDDIQHFSHGYRSFIRNYQRLCEFASCQ
jgi:hypothetical protein